MIGSGSFRDLSGFIFSQDNKIITFVDKTYKKYIKHLKD